MSEWNFHRTFSGRLLWTLEVIGTLVAMLIIAILMWYGWEHFLRAWDIGDSSIDIELPIWPGKLIVVIAFISLELRLLVQLCGFLRLVRYPDADPIGVPMIEPSMSKLSMRLMQDWLAKRKKLILLVEELNHE